MSQPRNADASAGRAAHRFWLPQKSIAASAGAAPRGPPRRCHITAAELSHDGRNRSLKGRGRSSTVTADRRQRIAHY